MQHYLQFLHSPVTVLPRTVVNIGEQFTMACSVIGDNEGETHLKICNSNAGKCFSDSSITVNSSQVGDTDTYWCELSDGDTNLTSSSKTVTVVCEFM
jgi:hypothetical protein